MIKKERIILTLICMMAINCLIAQSIQDRIFNNVILIEKEDVIQKNGDYLINVITDVGTHKNPVIFDDSRLPLSFFMDTLFKPNPFVLIKPDWKFYEKISRQANRNGVVLEPITRNVFYQVEYANNEQKVDSIIISGDQPKINFVPKLRSSNTNKSIVVYHTEGFGSRCCPKDPKWEVENRLHEFITDFENKNNITIGDVYKEIRGKESEHILYFTLSTLDMQQKLLFLQEIQSCYFPIKKTKDIKIDSQIFTPFLVRKEGLRLLPEK